MLLWWERLRDRWWARRLADAGIRTCEKIGLSETRGLRIGGGSLVLPRTGRAAQLLESYPHLCALSAAGAVYLEGDSLDAIVISGVRLNLFHAQAIQLAAEIFAQGVYAVAISRPVIVVDVGMNIGTAALFFAVRYPDAGVVGFEPISQSYQHALANLQANPGLAARIEPVNAAWGTAPGLRVVRYCPDSPGDGGFYEIPAGLCAQKQVREEEVRVVSAVESLDEIRQRYPGREIVLKLDCEGSEHEILSSLRDAGRLMDVRIVLVEWHRRAREDMPDRIRELLVGAGFVVFGDAVAGAECGLMKAVRT
ncbi:MAG: FkbM family methyltransferase [Verrucomicrobiae bacterium]|nr:FkbM family methyltransferase [Verrucomicrobiae bacterium]